MRFELSAWGQNKKSPHPRMWRRGGYRELLPERCHSSAELADGDPLGHFGATEDDDTGGVGIKVPIFEQVARDCNRISSILAGEEAVHLLVGVTPQEVVGEGRKKHATLLLSKYSAEHRNLLKRTSAFCRY